MNTVLVIIGVIFVLVAAGLFYAARGTIRKLAAMRAVATSSAGSVSSLHPGDAVEVYGTLRCESPLTSEFASERCAFYQSELTREYEEQEKDSSGRTRWDKRSESVANNSQRVAFAVEDETGHVQVDPEGANIDAEQVVNRFQQDSSGAIVVGGISIDLGFATQNGRRTLGYRSTEHVLKLDAPVYVLGVVRDDRSIGCASEGAKDKQFVVSYRSEDALMKDWQSSAKWLRVGSAVCGVVGIVALISAAVVR